MNRLLEILAWLIQKWIGVPKVSNVPSLPTDPVTGALDVAELALQAGLTIEGYKNTPEYLAAVQAHQERLERDTDEEISIKAAKGDPHAIEELQKRSSL